MHDLVLRLYPLCRSITGDGVRETLEAVAEHIALEVREVPTGTRVLDWTVPQEWNVRDAYVADGTGRRVIDFRASNLHLVGYSVPVRRRMSLADLRPHLHTLPEHPSWVPYRTSYYRPTWGFCVASEVLDALPEGAYDVRIDSTLTDGHLTYAEHVVPGAVRDEVLVSCHTCHPSLANDNLAAIAIAVALAQHLAQVPRHYTYRFVFAPGTIGAITWLAQNRDRVGIIRHGVVLACAGDRGRLTYKQSRRGDAEIDQVLAHVLLASGRQHEIRTFSPYGYDERQYCSPGFDLGVGCLTRTPYAEYPEYHTSADNPDLVAPDCLADTLEVLSRTFSVLDRNRRYVNLCPYGEPQLGRRGLYRSVGGRSDAEAAQLAMLWVLSMSDGGNSLLEIALRSGFSFEALSDAADALLTSGLIAAPEPDRHGVPPDVCPSVSTA